MRKAGVLLPIFSLPSKYGIGDFGVEAYNFIDKLKKAKQSYWQILPMGPTSYGDSPYQSFSTFAGNPYMIAPELFTEDILPLKEIEKYDFGSDEESIDYGKLYENRLKMLYTAYQVENYLGIEKKYPDFTEFCNDNSFWLEDYVLFMALKEDHGGAPWYEWEDGIKNHEEEALKKERHRLGDRLRFHCWLQYHFYRQWTKLKKYANENGIEIIGDIPIYVAFDSSDVWGNPELFQMDEERRPRWVAGVPPDGFSATGQLWGNPVYDWTYHKKTGYAWWIKRVEYTFKLVDVLRIDHFRGFDEYYCIPSGDTTAEFGHWEKGPGIELFKAMESKIGKRKIIAEDLGFLTDTVIKLVKETGYPGMKILEFAFDSREESDYLPHRWEKNCIAYTGTHDNQTFSAWFDELSEEDRKMAIDYMGLNGRDESEWNEYSIRMAFASVADTVIIPFQDWKGLGAFARINEPSTLGKNWMWRMKKDSFDNELIEKMGNITKLYRRTV